MVVVVVMVMVVGVMMRMLGCQVPHVALQLLL